MKIYRTVNPVAYENTYYLENDHSLILVDPGSDWATIQKQIDRIGKPIVAILLTHTHYGNKKIKKELSLYKIKAASSSTRWSHEAAFTNAGVSIVVASQAINIMFREYWCHTLFHFMAITSPTSHILKW